MAEVKLRQDLSETFGVAVTTDESLLAECMTHTVYYTNQTHRPNYRHKYVSNLQYVCRGSSLQMGSTFL
jgi:hypothetical protein